MGLFGRTAQRINKVLSKQSDQNKDLQRNTIIVSRTILQPCNLHFIPRNLLWALASNWSAGNIAKQAVAKTTQRENRKIDSQAVRKSTFFMHLANSSMWFKQKSKQPKQRFDNFNVMWVYETWLCRSHKTRIRFSLRFPVYSSNSIRPWSI